MKRERGNTGFIGPFQEQPWQDPGSHRMIDEHKSRTVDERTRENSKMGELEWPGGISHVV